MKSFEKMLMMGITAAALGGGMYMMMQNPKAKKQTGKAILKAMDQEENAVAKKIN